MRTTLKRLVLLERARAAETAALDLQDPEAIEAAVVLRLRAAELVDDLDDDDDDALLGEAVGV